MINSIALSTDFSEAGKTAFLHALRLAVEFKCRLDLLHVRDPADTAEWDRFPHVRETLESWNLLPAGSAISQISQTLGVTVEKVDVRDADASDGLSRFFFDHRPDLLVMASHGRVGLNRWLSGSVSNEVAMKTSLPTLLFGPASTGFVNPATGSLDLVKVTVPVDHDPSPVRAYRTAQAMLEGLDAEVTPIHVGSEAPSLGDDVAVQLIDGDVVEAIISESSRADLLVMPTAGRHGFLDAIRGSTTERVLHEAACPILAIRGG